MMAKIIKILFLSIFVILFSCEKQGLIVNCSECTTEEPVKTDLQIKVDPGYSGYNTFIQVYEGNLEDSVLYSSFHTSSTSTTIPVTLNKKYTVTATYYIPDDYYITVDSATPRVRYAEEQCKDPCYFVYDRDIDIRLKKIN